MRHDPERVLSLRVPRDVRPRLAELASRRGESRHRVALDALTLGLEALDAAVPRPPEAA